MCQLPAPTNHVHDPDGAADDGDRCFDALLRPKLKGSQMHLRGTSYDLKLNI
jgi:hypothetical protein